LPKHHGRLARLETETPAIGGLDGPGTLKRWIATDVVRLATSNHLVAAGDPFHAIIRDKEIAQHVLDVAEL
jgi:hypothetical protein